MGWLPPAETGEEHGPIIFIRHPQWTARNPHLDIPIMVFTRSQWHDAVEEQSTTPTPAASSVNCGTPQSMSLGYITATRTGTSSVIMALRSRALWRQPTLSTATARPTACRVCVHFSLTQNKQPERNNHTMQKSTNLGLPRGRSLLGLMISNDTIGDQITLVPEPASGALVGLGAVLLGTCRRRFA